MRTDLEVDWAIPPSGAGLGGRLERFMGPGKSRAESAAEFAGAAVCVLLLVAGIAASGAYRDWSGWQLVVVAVAGLDLVGGVLTNATNAAKRWYHREAPGVRRARLLFVGAHVVHLAAFGLVVLDDPVWLLGNGALLAAGAAAVEFAPVELKRVTAMTAYAAAVLVGLFWLEVPTALAWFGPLFFLKLLVCHLVPEAPLRARRPSDG
ncbi:hypothetical protein ACWGB8_33685 [Kitasatospora sp. NPDC054939]